MDAQRTEVVVVDIKMPFWSMVTFMIQLVIATIPAMIFLAIFGAIIFAAFGSLFVRH